METDILGADPHELIQTFRQLKRNAEEQYAVVSQKQTAERDCLPFWQEVAVDYEARREKTIAAAKQEEDIAARLIESIRRATAAAHQRLGGRDGYGLSPAEWTQAGALSGLAETLIEHAPIDQAVAELRTAVLKGDKPRAVAFAVAAERRLRSAETAGAERVGGRIAMGESQASLDALRHLIAEVRALARDTSLDAARAELTALGAAYSDLSGAVWRGRERRKGSDRIPLRPVAR